MSFLGRVLRFLFWVLVVSWVLKLVGRALAGSPQSSSEPGSRAAVDGTAVLSKRLVKDPVCGMHLAQELALPLQANGETRFFCSPECRAKYESSLVQRFQRLREKSSVVGPGTEVHDSRNAY